MAFNMLEAITQVREQINYHELHMRIGIHTVFNFYANMLGNSDWRSNRDRYNQI
jgi:hypothetical protein